MKIFAKNSSNYLKNNEVINSMNEEYKAEMNKFQKR